MSVTTGEVYFTHVDGRVGDIEITRSYSSARLAHANRYGLLGPGWNLSLDVRLNILSTNNPKAIELRSADGRPSYFVARMAFGIENYYQDRPFADDSTIRATPTGFLRTFRRGGSESYDSTGRLLSTTDPSGRQTTYGRDAQGRLTSVSRDNRTLTLEYVLNSQPLRLKRILGPGGAILVEYTYEPRSGGLRLEAVDYPQIPNGGYRFYFESVSVTARMTKVTDAAIPPVPIEEHVYDPTSGFATTSEIADGREKHTIEYLPPPVPPPPGGEAGRTRVTDAVGNVTTYDWNRIDHVRRIMKIAGPCASCGGHGESREWGYDDKGRIVEYTDGGGKTFYVYDPATGDLLTETKPLGHVTRYTYWPDGRLRKRENPNGGFSEFTYVPAGPDTITETVESTAGPFRVTDLDYDTQGRLEWITDPRGKRTQFAYDPVRPGDLVAVTNPLGTATPNDPNDHVTRFEYDELGRRSAVINPLGQRTETLYDARGNVIRVRQFDGPRLIDTTQTYTPGGRLKSVIDPKLHVTDYEYDPYGRLWKVFQPEVLQPNGTLVRPVTEYGYDLMSNVVSLKDAEGRTTFFFPDGYNRVGTIRYPGPLDEVLTYDTAGRIWTRERGGVTTTYGYDALHRLTSKTFSDGTPGYTYTYDANSDLGYMTSASHGGRTLNWDYDLAGQMRTETSGATGMPSKTVAYTYDLAGHRLSLSLNGSTWLTYEYDDASRLEKIYRGPNVFDFGYDSAGRRTTLDHPNGTHVAYGYVANGYDTLAQSRLTSVATSRNQAPVLSTAYVYDDAGNRLTKVHAGANAYAETYAYDALDRLRQVTRDATPSEEYAYDKVGNRNRGLPQWQYSDRNELMSTPISSFLYDLRGNRTTKVEGGVTSTYEWTAENQLKRILQNGGELARYEYDPIGRRVARIVGPVTHTYVYDGEDVLEEDFSSAIEEEGMVDPPPHLYVHGPGIDEPLAVKHGNDAEWHYHADGLGSVLGATDVAGILSHTRKYDTFGNPQDGEDEQGYAFTGREWDPESGLYYYRARYYDPKLGRFLSEDPIGFDGGVNFYAYVLNSPVNYTDPFGLETVQNAWGQPGWTGYPTPPMPPAPPPQPPAPPPGPRMPLGGPTAQMCPASPTPTPTPPPSCMPSPCRCTDWYIDGVLFASCMAAAGNVPGMGSTAPGGAPPVPPLGLQGPAQRRPNTSGAGAAPGAAAAIANFCIRAATRCRTP